MKKKFGLLAVFILGFLLAPISANIARAQSSGNQGLTITPFLLERQMEKGQSTDEIIDIINTSDRVLPVDITVNDFVPTGDDGHPEFLDPGQGDPHYSLSKWITITSNPKQELQPGEKTSIHFTITAPLDADDGGHYGAILFSSNPQGLGDQTAVAISQKIGAIILVKLGKVSANASISSFTADHGFYQYLPASFSVKIHNTGNVHIQPRGGISIYNMFGKKVGEVKVNENANNVLPNSSRVFKVQWDGSSAFGVYKAKMDLTYDDSGTVISSSTSFWVIPWKTTLAIALGLFILILLVVWGVRKYNKWLLTKAYGQVKVKDKE